MNRTTMRLLQATLALSLGVVASVIVPRDQSDEIACISVGQGDSTAIISGGRAALIDVGPNREGVDAGRTFVVPFLRHAGVSHVDWIFLSHPDLDHIGGLASVVAAYPGATVYISKAFETDPKMTDALAKSIPEGAAKVEWISSGEATLGNFQLTIRCPEWSGVGDDNEGSMFMKVADGAASFTTSGDAPAATEIAMIGQANWKAEVLHLGHHGSKTATSHQWLSAVDPVIAVASCGYKNEYGHPHRQTINRVKAFGAQLLRTDLDGDVVFQVHGSRLVRVNRS